MPPRIFVGSVIGIHLFESCNYKKLFSSNVILKSFKNLSAKNTVYNLTCFVNGTNEGLFNVSMSLCY